MGAVGGLLGTSGGANGSGFAGPSSGHITSAVTGDQADTAYNQNQDALTAQQSLLNTLKKQNGIGNQANVYNQLQGVVSGTGPNPAQAMLNQATGANVANQAALAAGQRGANANVGLLSRQAAQQGANLQQQAVGQGATMQAQQSLNALGQAGNLATTQAGQQIGQVNTNTQSQQNEQQQLLNAIAAQNNANVGMASNINSVNGQLANTTMQGQQGLIGGGLNSAGAALGLAGGGDVSGAPMFNMGPSGSGPQSSFGQFLMGGDNSGGSALNRGLSSFGSGAAKAVGNYFNPAVNGGGGNAALGPTMMAASGGMSHDYRSGGPVKAKSQNEKAEVSGNSYANDKIPAVLSEHEIVIPRSITMGKNPIEECAKFVAQELAKRKK